MALKETPPPLVASCGLDEVNAAYIQNNDNVNCKVESFTERYRIADSGSHGSNVEPNNLTKSSENQHPDLFPYAKAKESYGLSVSSWSENDASVPATSASDEASH
ncbi:hypothetical protein NC652_023034 [Populus alba x Populus x berolinensis]|nr:hypothetical protein NC652_023034 [Populus alba x Populus x berolinensis]